MKQKKVDTLYIIGNGFDLHHNLNTGYQHFCNYVSNNNPQLKNKFKKYFEFRVDEKNLWSNFEEDLGTFDWEVFFENNCDIDVQDDNFKVSSTYSLEDDLQNITEELIADIRNAFFNWLETINIEMIQKKLELQHDALFLSFNYTMVLEEVYGIELDKVLHIHNDINVCSDDLVFGHNTTFEEIPELDSNGDSNRTIFTDSESNAKRLLHHFYKPVNDIINVNEHFYKEVQNIKSIYVLGHSLNTIDLPYFKEVFRRANNAKWYVSYHYNEEKEKEYEKGKHSLMLKEIGLKQDAFTLFNLKEFYSGASMQR